MKEVKVFIEIYDREGKPAKRYEFKAKSWLRNFYQWMAALIQAPFGKRVLDTSGISVPIASGATYTWDENSAYRMAIAIGSGNTPVTLDDYDLANRIGAVNVQAIDVDPLSKRISFNASFNFAFDVTIYETGLLLTNVYDVNGALHDVLIERTVLDSPVTIPANTTFAVGYVIQF